MTQRAVQELSASSARFNLWLQVRGLRAADVKDKGWPYWFGSFIMPKYLWLARTLPFPLTAGDRIYSANLVEAVASAGVIITFLGHGGDAPPVATPGIEWRTVLGGQRNQFAAICHLMPLVAARHCTATYRAAIAKLAAEHWDAVVVDHYGMGWAARQRSDFKSSPVFVYITHNHEENLAALQWKDRSSSWLHRIYMGQNYLKTRRLERWTARTCDLLTTITQEDAHQFALTSPLTPSVILSPGYGENRRASRHIDRNVPRTVLLLGSFKWSAKLASLRVFLDQADPVMTAANITIRIVGDIAEDVQRTLEARYSAVSFTGFVDDFIPHLNARLAVVAEPIGGGFKLKMLDYIFNRVPIAALKVCAAGLPNPVRQHMILKPDLQSLLTIIVSTIDDFSRLNEMQEGAFAAADKAFDWQDRGMALRNAVQALANERTKRASAEIDT